MSKIKNKWVIYPDVNPTLDELKEDFMQENEKLNVEELDIQYGVTDEELIKTTDSDVEELQEGLNVNTEEGQEMSEEEQRQFYIEQLKKMHIRFNPIKHIGNKTINPYGTAYKQKRKQKNKQAKAARKANRKK
jgi:hypothetical protein